MDQNNFEIRKKEIIDKVTGILIDGLEKEQLTREKGQQVATFILEQKEKIHDETGLTSFLEKLSEQWPMYKEFVESQKKTKQFNVQDQQKLDQIKNQLSQLTNNSTQS